MQKETRSAAEQRGHVGAMATTPAGGPERPRRDPDLQLWLGFSAWAALAVLQVVWHGWLVPPGGTSIAAALALALIPLAVPLVHWRRPERALLVAAMISLLYFCHGVTEAWAAPHARVLAWIEMLLVVAIVLACVRKPRRRAVSSRP